MKKIRICCFLITLISISWFSVLCQEVQLPLVPLPQKYMVKKGVFTISSTTRITISSTIDRSDDMVDFFGELISKELTFKLPVMTNGSAKARKNTITFISVHARISQGITILPAPMPNMSAMPLSTMPRSTI